MTNNHMYKTDLNGKQVTKFDAIFKPDLPRVIVRDGKGYILPSSQNESQEEDYPLAFIQEIKGDWIYYNFRTQIMKIKIDGTEKTLIGDADNVQTNSDFVIDENWIYYINFPSGSLYKIKTDGTGNTRLNSDLSDIVLVDDGWIYYYNRSKQDGVRIPLYKIRIDGSDKKRMDKGWTFFDI